MISKMSKKKLLGSAVRGASLEVNGTAYKQEDLVAVAKALQPGRFLRIANSEKLSGNTLGPILKAAKYGAIILA